MRDKLPTKIKNVETGIVNLDKAENSGSHWVAYKKINNIVIYFDSFGNLKPPMELVKYFESGNDCNIIKYNHNVYQTYKDINCGHLCLKFLFENE